MIWVYLIFAGSIVYQFADYDSPFAQPMVMATGAIIAIYWIVRLRRNAAAKAAVKSIVPEEAVPVRRAARSDMLEGVRNWNSKGDVSAEVAVASCALGGRDAAHIRSLLAIASLRGDEAGDVVAGGARRILGHSR